MATLERARSLARNPRPLLALIGRVAVEYFRSGFDRGGVVKPWSAPYAGGDPPYVHIAGLVSDLARGAKPKSRRFIQGQAGRDTGALYKSMAFEVAEDGVDVGANPDGASPGVESYAGRFHAGGESEQAITPTVRRGLAALLRVGGKRGAGKEKARGLRGKLGFLFARDSLVTKQVARPLVGWTPELAARVEDTVRSYLGETDSDQARRMVEEAKGVDPEKVVQGQDLGDLFGIDLE